MFRRTVNALIVTLGLAAASGSAVSAQPSASRFRGVWQIDPYTSRLVPDDGTSLPFTPEGRALYRAKIEGLRRGSIVDQAEFSCVPQGMPRAMMSPYPFQIVTAAGQLVFAYEQNRAYRNINFATVHADPKVWDPSYMGDGIASWQGDVLVVDTTNIKADAIFLDPSGLAASDKLHVVEHLKLVVGGGRLEDTITVDDPTIFTKPWTARLTFRRQANVQVRPDWVCGEQHRDVSAVIGGKAR